MGMEELYPVIDAITLDCYNKDVNMIGQQNENESYNWRDAAEFVSQCSLPVIISGGISAKNVAEAIKQIMPYGIDACSCLKDKDTENCDQEKCVSYVKNAKLAFLSETI